MNRHASMNRIYRLVWRQVRNAWVPVAETAKARGESGRAKFLALFSVAMGCWLGACGVTSPIERADISKSHFEGAVYKGTATTIKNPTPGSDSYRVFVQGATGFVSMSAVRGDAEQRATDFCGTKGKRMDAIAETTADPPYMLGNFPRIEIVFQCVDAVPKAGDTGSIADPKYAKLLDLKKLLDSGVITQEEFDREKEKVLSQP